jgi:hypothetical protein
LQVTFGKIEKSLMLEFESSALAPEPGEQEVTNPGIFGTALAQRRGNRLRLSRHAADDDIADTARSDSFGSDLMSVKRREPDSIMLGIQ